jgi:hypothetical protein
MNEAELFARMVELRKIIDAEKRPALIDVTPQPEALLVPVQKESNRG